MSRTVPTPQAEHDTFAGLLERLAQRAQKEGAPSAPLPARTAKSLVSEVKPIRTRPASDATELSAELSYEKALRLHARRRSEEIPLDLPDPALGKPPSVPAPMPGNGASSSGQAKPSPRSAAPIPQPAETKPEPVAGSRTREIPRQPVRIAGSHKASPSARKPATPSQSAPPPRTPKAAHAESRSGQLPSSSRSQRKNPIESQTAEIPRPLKASPKQVAPTTERLRPAQRTRRRTPVSAKTAVRSASTPMPNAGVLLEKVRELQTPSSSLERISDQRRSIISVRLNEEEIARLRSRASESGISVSAYMRSCVLEAEHLRFQVKQALAEMRSYSHQAESRQVSALARAGQHTTDHSGLWSRLVAKSTTLFLGLWVFSRHRG